MLDQVHRWMAARADRVVARVVTPAASWRGFVALFLATFIGGTAALYLYVVLVDPYDVVAFSLPLERRLVGVNQRHLYPQIARSRRFDGVIIGSSTGRLLDPEIFNQPFGARFTNLAMNDMKAWEQKTMLDLFLRHAGPPKVLIIALDRVWCEQAADRDRISPAHGFPEWIYDDDPWNDYLHLLNTGTVQLAERLARYQLGLYRERIRYDGFEVFTPPESQFDLAHARRNIWRDKQPDALRPEEPPDVLSASQRQALSFPALPWLDDVLARVPPSTVKVLAYMPVHVVAQPRPGSRAASIEAECKERIAAIARDRGAKVVDWRIASPMTADDSNYWDELHYRLPIAHRIARDLVAAVIDGRESQDGSYRLVQH